MSCSKARSPGNCRMGLVSAALLLMLTAMSLIAEPAGSPRSAFAAVSSRPLAAGEVRIVPSLELEDITAFEMTQGSGARTFDLGRWQRSRSFAGLPPLLTEVRRALPALWRMGIDEGMGVRPLDVQYRVVAANGRRGYLSHEERPSSEIQVVLEPLQPTVVETVDRSSVLEGGVMMTLVLGDETRFAGRYEGTLTVVAHHL